jgi:MATE family multidrug resistance protein
MSSPHPLPGSHVPLLVGSLSGRHDRTQQFVSPAESMDSSTSVPRPRPTIGKLYGTDTTAGQLTPVQEHAPNEQTHLLRTGAAPGDILPEQVSSVLHLTKEIATLSRMASPVVVAFILQKSIDITSVFSLGHLGAEELAASALSTMFISVTGWSLALGMATALDTLASQAYTASPDPKALGIYLQRAIYILSIMSIPIIILWWHAEQVHLLLGQDQEVSRLSGIYIRWSIIAIPGYLGFECIKRYLQAQGIMHAGTYILAVTVPMNIIANYTLVWWPPIALGFIGAPIATACSYWLNLILGILFVRYIDGGQCWGGWSREALKNWGPFIRLSLAGVAFVCSEWWAFEIVALAAGYLGTVSLAAQSVVLTTASFTYMIPAGKRQNRIVSSIGLC